MPLSTILTAGSISPKEGDKVVLIQDGVSTILEQDATVDLTKGWNGWDNIHLQLIVGDGDQLNPAENTGYDVTIDASAEDSLFDGTKVYPVEESAAALAVNDVYYMPDYSYDENGQPIGVTEISVRTDAGWDGSETKVQLGLGDSWKDLSMEVYTGYYRTQAELDAAVAAGNSTKVDAGGYQADYSNWRAVSLTAVFSRSSGVVAVRPMYVYLYVPSDHVSESGLMNNRGSSVYRTSSSYTDDTLGIRVREYRLSSGNPVDSTYYFRLWYYQNNTSVENPEAYVYSCVGNFNTLAEAQASGAEDITSELFSSLGYDANYSGDGVIFSVFKRDDGTVMYQRKIVALPYVEEEKVASEPAPNEEKDTYFRVEDATVVKKYSAEDAATAGTATYTITCDTWVMPGDVDGYYYGYPGADVNYGCQTLFLLDADGDKAIAADEDGTVTLLPEFFQGEGVTVYAGHNGSSGTEQKNGETTVTTPWGEAVQYSAAAANGKALKNYWVTFVTQEEGPKLYVNAANVNKDEETGNSVRQVYLDSAHDYYHDVFISNIGDKALSGLSVSLEGAENVQLDEYWTVRADSVGTLDVFDTTNRMENIARIRLVAKRDENGNVVTGTVSGTLVIKATMGTETTEDDQEIRIKLEGSAGVERIVTDTLVGGVKYVPYASVIQTSAMGSSNAVQFTLLSGTNSMPEGVTLYENGKIYGVPMEYGTFTFTVEAYFTQSGNRETKTFTLQILDNTNENVWNATDEGYQLLDSVPEVLESYTDQVFRSNGAFNQFCKFFLDGQELVRGEDFDAEEGSTKITIRAQTFRDAGTGTHTIAAEFRTDKSDTNTVKKAAQNYTVPGGSSGGGGGGNMSSVNPPKPSVKPGTDDTQDTDGIFRDVSVNDWFYADVDWAYQEKLMIGVSEDLYAPDKAITSAMVVTVLARLDGVDLTAYEGAKYPQIEAGQWYTSAANWAMEMQLLEGESFDVNAPVARGDFAEMLVKYLRHAGIDCTLPENLTAFADADLMTEAENDAFQVLYDFGIFKGVGGYRMDPQGSTTRAQLAALLHRLSVFVENQK